MKKIFLKCTSLVIALMLIALSIGAYADTTVRTIAFSIPNRVFLNERDAGKLPGVTTSVYEENQSDIESMRGPGDGYVIGRARSWMTASNGYIRKGYKRGTLSSIGSIFLSFIPGVGTTVSAILGAVSIVASGSDMVSGETLITYRYKYRDGEGRWSSEANIWHLGYRTGQRETYKHVVGGKLNPSTQKWTLTMKNYPTAIKTEKSLNFSKSDQWLAEKGRQNVTTHSIYDECGW